MFQLEDKSRVVPDSVPRDAAQFDAWSDFACVEWPPALTIEAFHTAKAMRLGTATAIELFEEFLSKYESWLELPEGSKLQQMAQCQADSSSRDYHLSRAREAAVSNGDRK